MSDYTRQLAIDLLQATTPGKMEEVVKRLLEHDRKKHLAALPSAMTWTTEKPVKLGWYWFRSSKRHEIEIAKLWDNDGIYGQFYQDPHVFRVDEPGGEWAGPMSPPMEPPQ